MDAQGNPVRFLDQGDLSVLGGDSWKWLLVGPVAAAVSPAPATGSASTSRSTSSSCSLACACVVGGVLAWDTRQDRASAAEEQEPYGDVLAAARTEAEAFINIRYDDAQASIDEVVAGATGDFRDQYAEVHRQRDPGAPGVASR